MLTAHHDCEFRQVLDRVGDKWSLLVIVMLEQSPAPRARFSELKRSIPGISQRMLTATLRSLERDGLLTRQVYAEVPPRVEYALTPLGRQFMEPVRGLVTWLQTHWSTIRAARERFDRERSSTGPAVSRRARATESARRSVANHQAHVAPRPCRD